MPRGRLLPALLADPAQRTPLLGWLGVGLAVRLALMPFTVSADLLAVYWRSHLIAYDGQLFGGYLVNMGAHYVHAASLRLLDWLLPPPHVVWTHPWWWADSFALSPQILRWFSTQPWTYQTLFALKLPYLLADLGAGLALLALLARTATPHTMRRAWAFWMLSPIGLYASYMFGRYEMFAVALVLGALLACERERPWLGAVLLGLAITMRAYPLLLIPVFALIVTRRVRAQAAWAVVALAPLGVMMAMNRLLAGSAGELERLKDFPPSGAFLSLSLPVDRPGQVYLFVLFALLVYGALAGRVYGWWGSPGGEFGDGVGGGVPVGQLWMWLLVLHAGLFALTAVSAHYFAWFTPFVALALGRRPAWRGTLPLHLLQCAAVLTLAQVIHGDPNILVGLLIPLEPDLAHALPNLQELLLTSPQLGLQVAGVLRTGLLALTALLAIPAVAELAWPPAQAGDRERRRADEQHQPAEGERWLVAEQPSAR